MKLFQLTLLLSFLSIALFGKDSSQTIQKLNNPFLWSISKGNQTAYLFGTMHIPSPELSVLPLKVIQAIDKSDGVRTEIDMGFINQMKATQLMLQKNGKTLKKTLPEKLYRRSERYLKTISPFLTIEPFEQTKVWAFSMTISLLKDMMKHPQLKAIDDIIFTYGEEHNKSVGGVETIEEQMKYFDAFSTKEQILMLESTLDLLESGVDYMEEMKELYIQGEEKALLDFTKKQFDQDKYKILEEKFMDVLLYKRNKLMAKRIHTLLEEMPQKNYFFAFGTMHFIGEKSIITHLRDLGYKISRIK